MLLNDFIKEKIIFKNIKRDMNNFEKIKFIRYDKEKDEFIISFGERKVSVSIYYNKIVETFDGGLYVKERDIYNMFKSSLVDLYHHYGVCEFFPTIAEEYNLDKLDYGLFRKNATEKYIKKFILDDEEIKDKVTCILGSQEKVNHLDQKEILNYFDPDSKFKVYTRVVLRGKNRKIFFAKDEIDCKYYLEGTFNRNCLLSKKELEYVLDTFSDVAFEYICKEREEDNES